MGAKKIKIPRDWFATDGSDKLGGRRKESTTFDEPIITKSEDLPELMTTKEAAQFLRRHPKTVEEYRNDGSLKFIKIRNRFFTTPEYIAQFLNRESYKK